MTTITNIDALENGIKEPSSTDGRKSAPYAKDQFLRMNYSFVITAGITNNCMVEVTALNGFNVATADATMFQIWLSDSSSGYNLSATSPSSPLAVSPGSGFIISEIDTGDRALNVQTNSSGVFTLSITDTAKTAFYIAVQNVYTGQVIVSRQLTTADYGA